MIEQAFIVGLGLTAQLLFAARMVVQWALSERYKKVVSPGIFWRFSLVASILMCIYGWLRSDAAIIVGQLITYFIYIRNLQLKGEWSGYRMTIRVVIWAVPLVTLVYLLTQQVDWHSKFISGIPTWLIVLGLTGQILFTFRFIIQYYFAERTKSSILPPQFWTVSLIGAFMIFIYGIFRMDYVLIIGNGGGMIAYIRNLMIGRKSMVHA